jgi:hemerythrin-like metal-binding protein
MDSARTIKALTECGAITAALKAEHYAIEDALQTLDGALFAGASRETLTRIMDIVVDFCVAHFTGEEQEFGSHKYAGTEAHAKAHERLLKKFRGARRAVVDGQIEGALDAADLLDAFHDHVSRFDRPAHEYVLQQRIGRAEGDILNTTSLLFAGLPLPDGCGSVTSTLLSHDPANREPTLGIMGTEKL